MTLKTYRRATLAAAAFAVPLTMAAATAPTIVAPAMAASAVNADAAEAAERAATEAEAEAQRALDAVPVAKDAIPVALAAANTTRDAMNAHQPKIKKATKRVKNLTKQVKKARANVAKAKKARKARARTVLANKRKQLSKARQRVQNRRATMKNLRAANDAAWAAWRTAKSDFESAKKYAETTAAEAARLRDEATRLRGEVTVVTRATVDVLPQINQANASAQSAAAAKNVVAVTALPAVAHMDVDVQRLDGTRWVTVAEATTLENGRVDVPVAASNSKFRAVVNGKTSNIDVADRKMVFSDEFSGPTLGGAWNHRMQTYLPDAGRTCSKGDPSAVTNTASTVKLWVTKDTKKSGKCSITSGGGKHQVSWRNNGHISTQDSFAFTYGIAAARVKMHDAKEGQHSAFWMQPKSYSGKGKGPLHTGAEIDVFEFFGQKSAAYTGLQHSTYHTDVNGKQVKDGGMLPDVSRFLADKDDKWFNRYHVISVEWTPTEYIFRIDGQESYRSSVGVSGRPQYLILSMLSSDYNVAKAGAQGEKDLGTQNMEVDWVRVWQ